MRTCIPRSTILYKVVMEHIDTEKNGAMDSCVSGCLKLKSSHGIKGLVYECFLDYYGQDRSRTSFQDSPGPNPTHSLNKVDKG